jgi:PAS domain S-box-containing protein
MMKSLITQLRREIESIKEQLREQQEIAQTYERLSYITRVTSDCIWDWDAATGKTYRSDSFTDLTGYALYELQGDKVWWCERIHPEDRERVIRKMSDSQAAGNTYWNDEYRFLCKDGNYKYLADKAYIVYRDGKPVRGVGIVQDQTEKKKLEAELASHKANENKALISAQEHERGEISKELHENVSQMLSSVSVLLGFINSADKEEEKAFLDKSQQYLKMAISEIRKISYSLNASLVQEVGLHEPVEDIIGEMRQHSPIKVHFTYNKKLENIIPTEQKLAIYRIIQEQTNNVMQHAEASEVTISLTCQKGMLQLAIRDNGKGFDPEKHKHGKGVGLINIRNRVDAFNGALQIQSAPAQGCLLEVKMPIEQCPG